MNNITTQEVTCKLTGQFGLLVYFWSLLKPVLKPTHLHNIKSKTQPQTHLEQLKEIRDETVRESRPPDYFVRHHCYYARPRCRCPVRERRHRDVIL